MKNIQMPNLKWEDGIPIKCENCGSEVFIEGITFRRFSKILTGTQQDGLMPAPVIICAKCGHLNEEFKPKQNVIP